MKKKKGDKLTVIGGRKTPLPYDVIVAKDFDTDKDEWWDVKLDQETTIYGINNAYHKGDDVPCRRGIDKIIPRKKEQGN